jgi:PHD/YefM family antitoxin component YafN of YafNO toxin-antitoxin module
MEKRLDLLDLPPDVRQLVGECELTGRHTVFERNGRAVVILVSYDEYLALRETIDISNDAALRASIERAEEDVKRNALLLPEDLFETMNDER